MSESGSRRTRPQRIRKASRKHADSLQWTEETMGILRASSESSDRSSTSSDSEAQQRDSDVVSDGLAVEAVNEEVDEEDEEQDIDQEQMSEDSIQSEGHDEKVQMPKPKRLKTKKAARPPGTTSRPNKRVQGLIASKISFTGKGLRNRMMLDSREIIRSGNADSIYQQNYGPLVEDLYHVLQSRNVWHVAPRDITLPSKKSLSTALGLIPEGYINIKVEPVDKKVDPANPTKLQATQEISSAQAIECRYYEPGYACRIVLGPWTSAGMFTLDYMRPFDLSRAWLKSGKHTATSDKNRETGAQAWHKAWLIDTAAKPDCIAWSYGSSDFQFLAVSFGTSRLQRNATLPRTSKLAPAYSASPEYPSSIQIWCFQAISTSTVNEPRSLSYAFTPKLSQTLCFKWGSIKRFEWITPVQAKSSEDDAAQSMVLLTSDGCIRLIGIDLDHRTIDTNIEYTGANIVIRPPSTTIFTAFCLASRHDIVTGAADGAIRIYNTATTTSDEVAQPYLIHQIHTNYIMAVSVPPELPYYICSSSASGDLILTDLRSPDIDKIALHKARHPTRNLSYLPFVRTFITTNDGAGNSEPTGTAQCSVIAHSIRHFQYINTIMKLPDSSGLTTCLATSPFHPCLLVANAQGSVFATNHLRRYLPVSHASSSWAQKIFEYDWQPLVEHSSSAAEQGRSVPTHLFVSLLSKPTDGHSVDLYHGHDVRPGISRMHEGFRPERVDLGIQSKMNARKASVLATTQAVFHEEQAVTAMAWNPNPKFAGWAAIGWGSGILRIQDLSHNLT